MSVVDLLRRVSIFADLRDEELNALAACLGKRAFGRDVILFHKGCPARNLYIIESGEVRIFALSDSGQEITLEVYGPGECFGETALLDGNVRTSGAVVLEKTVMYTLDRSQFLRCLERHPQVARRVMELLAHRLEHTMTYAENLAFLDVAGRVAAVLLELAARRGTSDGGVRLDLHLTQAELASWVCASREMVNKVLQVYQTEGLIATERHTILVLDPNRLGHKIACK